MGKHTRTFTCNSNSWSFSCSQVVQQCHDQKPLCVDVRASSPLVMPFDSAATMARRQLCQVCGLRRSGFRRMCHVCRRRVGPGCWPYCLAQDGSLEWPQTKRSLCKDCFLSLQQAILPLAVTVPEALVIVAELNRGKHCWHPRDAIERTSTSF